jgi:aspartate/methionine/tyrosine aminotransferase
MTAGSVADRGAARAAGRLGQLAGEGALDVLLRARALEAAGRRVAHLELGEPDFPTPPHVVEAALRALRDGDTRYTPPAGLPELRAAIAASEAARGVAATPEQVVVTPGVKLALFYAALTLIEPGVEVLVPDPGFPIYPSVTRFAGGTPVPYGLRPADYGPDVDEIAARITPRTRVLVLNGPHNPAGGTPDAGDLERLAELVERHDLAVITDDVYERITYADGAERAPSLATVPGLQDRLILINGFSKAYAMTGWRLGYAVVPPALAERVSTLAVNGHTCVATVVQRAGIAALTGPQTAVRAMVAELRRRRDEVIRELAAIPGVTCPAPAGAFYAFPDVAAAVRPAGLSADDLAARLLEDYGVAVLAGTAFGPRGAGHLRISFGAPPEAVRLAVRQLRACLGALGDGSTA